MHGAPDPSRFPVLRFMRVLKAAHDFGLDHRTTSDIAARFDPRSGRIDHLAGQLAAALVARGAVRLPDAA